MTIRQIYPDDWETYRFVRLAMLQDEPGAYGSTYELDVTFDESHWRKRLADGEWFIAEEAGNPCGSIAVLPDSENTRGRYIGAMWVSPEKRGTRLASDLISKAYEIAEQDEAKQLRLHVAEKNPRAIAFYEKCGFVLTGNTALANRPVDPKDLEMICDLTQLNRSSRTL